MTDSTHALPEKFFCGQLSRQYNEPLFGTASHFQSLFLLECPEAWGNKALAESQLIPEHVKDALKVKLDALQQPRLLLIRQNEKARDQGDNKINFFVVNNKPGKSHYNHVTFNSYEDLVDFDFAAALDYTAQSRHEPLYLVCTNGNKDKCCAKFGMSAYKHLLTKIPKERVWQCAHVGGDRFAPNIVTAPEGAYFSRLGAEQMDDFITATESGQITLEFYRGRSWYKSTVQSAEHYIRREFGYLAFDALEWIDQSVDNDIYSVTFYDVSADKNITVMMVKEISDYEFFLTCQATAKSKVESFKLVGIVS